MNVSAFTSSSTLQLPTRLTHKLLTYLRKNYRYLIDDPRFFWMKTVARFELARELATRPRTARRTRAATPSSSLLRTEHELERVVSTLRTEGYFVGLDLAPEVVTQLREHCEAAVCYGDRKANRPFRIAEREALERELGQPFKVASYFDEQERWPVFQALRADPWLAEIGRAYLGCEPVYLRSEIAWSFPATSTRAEKVATAQVFHCDINDYKTLKFFFYLTDVGPMSGPHSYIKKNTRTLLHQLLGQRVASLPDGVLVQTYGEDQVVTVCGAAGTGFIADPYYFHRGATPTDDSRLMLQIELGCQQYKTWYFDV